MFLELHTVKVALGCAWAEWISCSERKVREEEILVQSYQKAFTSYQQFTCASKWYKCPGPRSSIKMCMYELCLVLLYILDRFDGVPWNCPVGFDWPGAAGQSITWMQPIMFALSSCKRLRESRLLEWERVTCGGLSGNLQASRTHSSCMMSSSLSLKASHSPRHSV